MVQTWLPCSRAWSHPPFFRCAFRAERSATEKFSDELPIQPFDPWRRNRHRPVFIEGLIPMVRQNALCCFAGRCRSAFSGVTDCTAEAERQASVTSHVYICFNLSSTPYGKAFFLFWTVDNCNKHQTVTPIQKACLEGGLTSSTGDIVPFGL